MSNKSRRTSQSFGSKPTPKFHYMTVLSHQCDDVPVLLVDDYESAFDFANSIAWELTGTPLAGVLDLPDMSTPVCVAVITSNPTLSA